MIVINDSCCFMPSLRLFVMQPSITGPCSLPKAVHIRCVVVYVKIGPFSPTQLILKIHPSARTSTGPSETSVGTVTTLQLFPLPSFTSFPYNHRQQHQEHSPLNLLHTASQKTQLGKVYLYPELLT